MTNQSIKEEKNTHPLILKIRNIAKQIEDTYEPKKENQKNQNKIS